MANPANQGVTNVTMQLPLYLPKSKSGVGEGFPATQVFSTKAASAYNLVPVAQADPLTGENRIILEKRNGFGSYTSIPGMKGSATTHYWHLRDVLPMTQLGPQDWVAAYLHTDSGTGVKTIKIIHIKYGSSVWTEIGSIATVAGPPAVDVDEDSSVYLSEIKIGNVPGVAVIITRVSSEVTTTTSSSAGYYALTSSGAFSATTLTKISDADFPTNQTPYVHLVGPLVQMNQICYVMASDGRIYNSNTDSIGTWSALGFLEAESYSDKGVGLLRYKHHLIAFGEKSIEFFDDVGNDPTTGSPLERTSQAFIKFGCIYGKAFINMDDVVYWVSLSNTAETEIYKLDGYTPVLVSTREVSKYLNESKTSNYLFNRDTVLQATSINGIKTLYVSVNAENEFLLENKANFTLETSEPAFTNTYSYKIQGLMLNLRDNFWWTLGININPDSGLLILYFWSAADISFMQPSCNGLIPDSRYYLGVYASWVGRHNFYDYDYSDSSNNLIVACWSSSDIDFGTENRKFLHKFKINPIVQHGSITASNPEYYKLILKKDYKYGSSAQLYTRNIKVPDDGEDQPRIYGNNLGAFRNAVFAFVYQGAGAFSIKSAEVSLTMGTA